MPDLTDAELAQRIRDALPPDSFYREEGDAALLVLLPSTATALRTMHAEYTAPRGAALTDAEVAGIAERVYDSLPPHRCTWADADIDEHENAIRWVRGISRELTALGQSRASDAALVTAQREGWDEAMRYILSDEVAVAAINAERDRRYPLPSPPSVTHDLKVWPQFFGALLDGTKTFEWRKDDRNFREGDTLVLKEWSTEKGYTGRSVTRIVSYILRDGFDVPAGYAVLALATPEAR